MTINTTNNTIPISPMPRIFKITIAISHDVLKKSATGLMKQEGGGSVPSSGFVPSGVIQWIAEIFRSKL